MSGIKHVLIHGPGACGKTLNKDFLASQFGCESIMDGVGLSEFLNHAVAALGRTLYLTAEVPDLTSPGYQRRAEVLSFDDAMRRSGVAAYGEWHPGFSLPGIARGTELAVRMRGQVLHEKPFIEVNGFYLNEYGLYYEDGCECFAAGENPEGEKNHEAHGCPHTGFYFVDPEGDSEFNYQNFACVSWCKR